MNRALLLAVLLVGCSAPAVEEDVVQTTREKLYEFAAKMYAHGYRDGVEATKTSCGTDTVHREQ